MSPAACAARACLGVLVLASAACSVAPSRAPLDSPAAEARQAKAAAIERWHVSGRVAVSDGREGGSGRFDWYQDGAAYVMTIRAPVSNQTWRLSGDAGRAKLEGAAAGPMEGADPEELLVRGTGWHLPVRQMRDWVRAIPHAPGADASIDARGLPSELSEAGWTLQFRSYDQSLDPPMPTRLAGTRPPFKVRLAISSWNHDE